MLTFLPSKKSLPRDLWLLAGIWFITIVCNATKAVHMDDPVYLYSARSILEDFFQPYGGVVRWATKGYVSMANIAQPVFSFYWLAGIIKIFGESELALHLGQSVYSLLAIACFYRSAKLLSVSLPVAATALFAVSPSFLPSQNLMTDVPLVALCLLSFMWTLKSVSSTGTVGQFLVAGIALSLACLTKYTAVALVPLYGTALFFRGFVRSFLPALIPALLIGVWAAVTYYENGLVHFMRPQVWEAGSRFSRNSIDWLVCLGALTPFSFIFLSRFSDGKAKFIICGISVVAAALVPAALLTGDNVDFYLSSGARVFWGNGFFTLLSIGGMLTRSFFRRKESPVEWRSRLLLGLWLLGGFLFIVLFSRAVAVRHLLIELPPIILFLFSYPLRNELAAKHRSFAVSSAVAITGILGILLAVSDASFAGMYRTYAKILTSNYQSAPNIWAVGDWGWQWYAQKNGMKTYVQDSPLGQADIVVIPALPVSDNVSSEHQKFLFFTDELVVPAGPQTWLRTVSAEPWGGFYFSKKAALPWRVDMSPLETFSVYRFLPYPSGTIRQPTTLRLSDTKPKEVILEGFHQSDTWGRWTSNEISRIIFADTLPPVFTLQLTALARNENLTGDTKITVGNSIKSVRLGQDAQTYSFEHWSSEGSREIQIESPFPPSLPGGGDTRLLGVAVVSVQIIPEA